MEKKSGAKCNIKPLDLLHNRTPCSLHFPLGGQLTLLFIDLSFCALPVNLVLGFKGHHFLFASKSPVRGVVLTIIVDDKSAQKMVLVLCLVDYRQFHKYCIMEYYDGWSAYWKQ
jgi:hypothetical protein